MAHSEHGSLTLCSNASCDHRRLVVVHGINGRKMKKYYIIGSTFMSIALTLPAYAAGQYGYVISILQIICVLSARFDRAFRYPGGTRWSQYAGIRVVICRSD